MPGPCLQNTKTQQAQPREDAANIPVEGEVRLTLTEQVLRDNGPNRAVSKARYRPDCDAHAPIGIQLASRPSKEAWLVGLMLD